LFISKLDLNYKKITRPLLFSEKIIALKLFDSFIALKRPPVAKTKNMYSIG
jgi:hypothetical protein